jgi:hypothetical protein
MTPRSLGINVSDAGIGQTLNQYMLTVPPNQRSYAWEESHVQTLFEDLSRAIYSGGQPYFLGTVVLTQGSADRLEVADGQQRLATTSILIAAIRDYLESMGGNERRAADKYTSDYLLIYDEMTTESTPKLKMNYEDNDFFLNQILTPISQASRTEIEPSTPSHLRLFRAARFARGYVEKLVSNFARADKAKELYNWIKFLRDSAMVITIRVPDHINAYTLFETLNDRGLRASQADILKNALFGKAQDRLSEIQSRWSSMVASIDTAGDEDLLLTYIRHQWTLSHGYTAERELGSLVKDKIQGRQGALGFVIDLDEHAGGYVGLLSPLEYNGWTHIDKKTRAHIFIITRILGIEQIRPLIVAVLRKFQDAQAKLAIKMFLAWSVRFLVAGSGGGGPLDRAYGQLAKEVMDGSAKSAKELRERVRAGVLRTDPEFRQAFSKARVSKTTLARYYLRALELFKHGEKNPELGDTLDDSYRFNVEHVMPQSETPGWNIDEQTALQLRKRLGNMVLLDPDINVKLGNKPFAEKKLTYADSPLLLTKAIADFSAWGPLEIDERQESLAELAVQIWPS